MKKYDLGKACSIQIIETLLPNYLHCEHRQHFDADVVDVLFSLEIEINNDIRDNIKTE
jgi:hypothetical protein